MNAETLLELMKAGAVLKTHWSYSKRRIVHEIILTDGTIQSVQYSNIKALLKRGTIHSIPWIGGRYDYVLAQEQK